MWRVDVYAVSVLPLPIPGRELVDTRRFRWRWVARLWAWLALTVPALGVYYLTSELTHEPTR